MQCLEETVESTGTIEDTVITDSKPIAAVVACAQGREAKVQPCATPRRLKILYVTVGLDIGGTEGQVRDVVMNLDRSRFECRVCALKGDGQIARELAASGVKSRLL